jgi:hypothetical protein
VRRPSWRFLDGTTGVFAYTDVEPKECVQIMGHGFPDRSEPGRPKYDKFAAFRCGGRSVFGVDEEGHVRPEHRFDSVWEAIAAVQKLEDAIGEPEDS